MPQGGWNQWTQQWSQGKSKDKREKDKAKGKGSAPATTLPAYDLQPWSSQAGSSKEDGAHKGDFWKAALQEIVNTNRLEVPDKLKEMMQDNVASTISKDQKLLNQKRKFLAKLDRLKKAEVKKTEQWTSFKQDLKEHLQKEQCRYERACRTPPKAQDETQVELDKLMGGEITEQVSDMEQEAEEFEAWLKEKTTDSKEKTEAMDSGAETKAVAMDAALRATQDNQRMLAQQLHEMQTQMTYMAQLLTMPKTPMPATGGVRSPTQVATTPDSGTKRKSALEPFSRAHRAEPYGRHPPSQETTKDGLETLDGT